ncbi:MAG: hypothetical protein M3454_08410 [Actinomycetota bacterium]|nr:hypothetical protein [Actinomycetota bacterium]
MRNVITFVASLAVLALLIPGTVLTAVGLVFLFLTTLRESLGARWRLVIAGTLGGLAGGLTAAAGSRIAMRIVSLAVPGPTAIVQGSPTRVPLFTLSGTMDLIGFVGIVGTVLGVAAMAVRRLVPLSGLRRGLALGTIMLAFPGILIFVTDPEFDQVPPVSISSFGACFIAYGIVFEAIASRVERWGSLALPMPFHDSVWKTRGAQAAEASVSRSASDQGSRGKLAKSD